MWYLSSSTSHGPRAFDPDGSFVYGPDPGYNGPHAFTYVTSDGVLWRG